MVEGLIEKLAADRAVLAALYSNIPMPERTNREVEIKLRVGDLLGLVDRLRQIKAVVCGRVHEQNTLYDTADSDLRRQGRLLRLRTETPAPSQWCPGGPRRAVLTSKVPARTRHRPRGSLAKPRYKERLEREVVVGGARFRMWVENKRARPWPSVLRCLGFCPVFRYEKFRASFRLGSLHLELDETPVGVFLELEGHPASIDRAARALGFSSRDYIQSTYWDLYRAQCLRRGHTPRNLLFEMEKS